MILIHLRKRGPCTFDSRHHPALNRTLPNPNPSLFRVQVRALRGSYDTGPARPRCSSWGIRYSYRSVVPSFAVSSGHRAPAIFPTVLRSSICLQVRLQDTVGVSGEPPRVNYFATALRHRLVFRRGFSTGRPPRGVSRSDFVGDNPALRQITGSRTPDLIERPRLL